MKAFDWAELLRNHPFLSSLDEKHLQWLLSEEISTECSYEPGALIFREGDVGDSIFLIGSGSAEAVLSAGGGQTILLSVMLRGETFGEMGFFEGRPRSATVQARETCVVLEIKGQRLRRLPEAHPGVEFKVLLQVSGARRRRGRTTRKRTSRAAPCAGQPLSPSCWRCPSPRRATQPRS